jgi:hypothetical protein
MALWDAVAKIEERPLFRRAGRPVQRRANGRARVRLRRGRLLPAGKARAALQDEMKRYLGMGYTVVKMKIGGDALSEDVRRIEAVLDVVEDGRRLSPWTPTPLRPRDGAGLRQALAPYRLRWYEEAGRSARTIGSRPSSAEAYPHPLATGENLFSHQDARNLLRYGGMRPDARRSPVRPRAQLRLVEYLRTLERSRRHGWSRRRLIPHGGHLFAVHIALGLGTGGNEPYPGVFEPFGGFPDEHPRGGRSRPAARDSRHRLRSQGDLYAVLRAVAE